MRVRSLGSQRLSRVYGWDNVHFPDMRYFAVACQGRYEVSSECMQIGPVPQ